MSGAWYIGFDQLPGKSAPVLRLICHSESGPIFSSEVWVSLGNEGLENAFMMEICPSWTNCSQI